LTETQESETERQLEAPVEDRMRFDRRLANRQGWIAPEVLAEHLANLPDASQKAADPDE
jgi:hypothetical protein